MVCEWGLMPLSQWLHVIFQKKFIPLPMEGFWFDALPANPLKSSLAPCLTLRNWFLFAFFFRALKHLMSPAQLQYTKHLPMDTWMFWSSLFSMVAMLSYLIYLGARHYMLRQGIDTFLVLSTWFCKEQTSERNPRKAILLWPWLRQTVNPRWQTTCQTVVSPSSDSWPKCLVLFLGVTSKLYKLRKRPPATLKWLMN